MNEHGYNYPQYTKVHNLREPNAVYVPKDKPIRMALNRDESEVVDVVGIAGYARWSPESPNGQVLFTIDGAFAKSEGETYWIWPWNLQPLPGKE